MSHKAGSWGSGGSREGEAVGATGGQGSLASACRTRRHRGHGTDVVRRAGPREQSPGGHSARRELA